MTPEMIAGVVVLVAILAVLAVILLVIVVSAIFMAQDALADIGTHKPAPQPQRPPTQYWPLSRLPATEQERLLGRWAISGPRPPEVTTQYWSAQSQISKSPPGSRRGYNPWPLMFVVGCLIVTIIHTAITGH